MKMTSDAFLALPKKRITLMGMSGSGKTYITRFLEDLGWSSYSCDYMIGSKFLTDDLANIGTVSTENIRALSKFIGKLGKPELGGYTLDVFKERQNAYYQAECAAVAEAVQSGSLANNHFVHDSTGSLCEIMDEDLIAAVGEQTLFVYLQATEEDEKNVLQRAQDYPKPLFFPPLTLDFWIAEYLSLHGVDGVNEMNPDDFARWVFPKLFESRKPKYQRLADLYGVTIPARSFLNVKNEQDFIDIIAHHLG